MTQKPKLLSPCSLLLLMGSAWDLHLNTLNRVSRSFWKTSPVQWEPPQERKSPETFKIGENSMFDIGCCVENLKTLWLEPRRPGRWFMQLWVTNESDKGLSRVLAVILCRHQESETFKRSNQHDNGQWPVEGLGEVEAWMTMRLTAWACEEK